ncbi:hypothetical protein CCACVL1_22441 [Corchorus capsularis]|uniref:Uncharacterized protein n=1 Tax=Corchorus capsularis TaxID=210143 RepID=A0A1R3GYG7_COCAP|nr:hypothetical protein CCACVL1_22441 [Corchorus capsularis]
MANGQWGCCCCTKTVTDLK